MPSKPSRKVAPKPTKKKQAPAASDARIRIEYESLRALAAKPAKLNPKSHHIAGIASAFAAVGFVDPPILDERTGRLVHGHGRVETLLAGLDAGEQPPERVELAPGGDDWLVPVVRGVAFANDKAAGAYAIGANQLTIAGGFDEAMLAEVLASIKGSAEARATGMTAEEIDALISEASTTKGEKPPKEPKPAIAKADPKRIKVVLGDCVEVLAKMKDESASSIVCDPPYSLSFMGSKWDDQGHGAEISAWHERWLREAFRVLKPGGHLVAFGGTRTYHRLAVAVEDVGFEIRDSLHWVYSSGFPKSLNVSKALDDSLGATRTVVGTRSDGAGNGSVVGLGSPRSMRTEYEVTNPATPQPEAWRGFGTALKPAHEPMVLARKPLDGTVAQSILVHGTGALNVEESRVGADELPAQRLGVARIGTFKGTEGGVTDDRVGRWPPNVAFSHADACKETECEPDCPVAELDRQSGITKSPPSRERSPDKPAQVTRSLGRAGGVQVGYDDEGGASRCFPCFRYVSKASVGEREAGLKNAIPQRSGVGALRDGGRLSNPRMNTHNTVKPIDVMRWLARLVTPPDGLIVDPFMGSGTCGIAAALEGFRYIGIEKEAPYFEIARGRIFGDLAQATDDLDEEPAPAKVKRSKAR